MLHVKEEDIDKITEAFYLILKGKKPSPLELPQDYPDNEISQAVSYINKFINEYNNATDLIYTISRGDLDFEPPGGKMLIVQSLKNLQASLRHLTWTTQQIAKDRRQVTSLVDRQGGPRPIGGQRIGAPQAGL